MVICLEQGADLHMVQLMPLPLTVSCFSKIQIGLTFLILAHLGSLGKRAVKWVCVCLQMFVTEEKDSCLASRSEAVVSSMDVSFQVCFQLLNLLTYCILICQI